jgi:hypothetical protein
MRHAAVSALFLLALVGCGGGGHTVPAAPAAPAGSGPASATFTLEIPTKAQNLQRGVRRPSYVSPATNSVTVTVDGGAPQAFNASGNTLAVGLGGLTPASHTFGIDEYAGQNGTGAHLATASVTQTLVPGPNTITVVAKGIVASASISLALQDGVAGTVPVSIVALDAAGQTISGPYATTFNFTSGSSHAPITGSVASSTQTASIAYDGACLAGFTISATDGTVNASLNVGSLFHIVGTLSDSGTGSLRAALATQAPGDSEVATVSGTVYLTSSLPPITTNVSICTTAGTLTLDGASAYHILTVNSGGTLTTNGVSFAHAVASASPGGALAVNTGGTATVTGATFNGNTGSQDGNSVYVGSGATATITNATFSSNSSSGGSQGAVRNDGTLTISNSAFNNNTIPSGGGSGAALYASGGAMTVVNTTFDGNTALSSGSSAGVLFGAGGNVTMQGCTIGAGTPNTAYSNAGAIYFAGGPTKTLTISQSTFENSTATLATVAGAVLVNGTTAIITQSYFASNTIGGQGGAIYVGNSGTATITNSTLTLNTGTNGGGGLAVGPSSTANLLFDTFDLNTGATGGNVQNAGGTLTATGTIFANGVGVNAPDVGGTINSGDYNYITSATGASYSGTHYEVNTTLTLGSAALNGGTTLNLLPAGSDSVVGYVPLASCTLTVDQRGDPRPHLSPTGCTVGADEP